MSKCRQLQRYVDTGDGNSAKRMLLGKFEVTAALIYYAENTGDIQYRRNMIQTIHDTDDI